MGFMICNHYQYEKGCNRCPFHPNMNRIRFERLFLRITLCRCMPFQSNRNCSEIVKPKEENLVTISDRLEISVPNVVYPELCISLEFVK